MFRGLQQERVKYMTMGSLSFSTFRTAKRTRHGGGDREDSPRNLLVNRFITVKIYEVSDALTKAIESNAFHHHFRTTPPRYAISTQ
jgi:hypothetical protein